MEENLVAVSGMVGNLKNMAVDMQCEITSQNKQLDKILVQVDTLQLLFILFLSSP